MAEKKLWRLTITTAETAHNDTWPIIDVVSATDEEMAQLEEDLGIRLFDSYEIGDADNVGPWRKEHYWLFDGE